MTHSTIIRRGDRGERVKQLQAALTLAGFPVAEDGIFGRGTELAVRAFQDSAGIEADGLVGPDTWRELGETTPLDPPPAQDVYRKRVERARGVVRRGIRYYIGHGGFNPKAALPGKPGPVDPAKVGEGCDCSGFGAWCCGVKRGPLPAPWPQWFETTKLVRDANGPQLLVRKTLGPVVGGFVAYPDRAGSQGHIAVVTGINPLRGVDCSSSRSKATGEAITERGLAFMVARPDHAFFVLATDPQV